MKCYIPIAACIRAEDHRRCYLHLYYNAHMKADAVDQFLRQLLGYKEELESGNLKPEHKEMYDTFFVIIATLKRWMKVSLQQRGSESVYQSLCGILDPSFHLIQGSSGSPFGLSVKGFGRESVS